MTVAVSAALSMEFHTFCKNMGRVEKLPLDMWHHFVWLNHENRIILLETGIGPQRASGAFQSLIKAYQVDCIINFGSSGMINECLNVGDALLVQEIIDASSGAVLKADPELTESIASFLEMSSRPYFRGRLLTSPEPIAKRSHRQQLAEQFHVDAVDMEAFAIAKIAKERGIPFAALKMISDRATALTRLEYWKNIPKVDKLLGKLM
ncbi:MAG: hypothetical protein ABH878_10765, partial [bacterium]